MPHKPTTYLLALLLAACGGDEPSAPNPNTLAAIQNDIFNARCLGCHSSGDGSGGLLLTSGSSYDELVNEERLGLPGDRRVIPGDPDNSYLVWKIEGDARISGNQMPSPSSPLSADEISRIRQWISNGATNNTAGILVTSALISSTPTPDEEVATPLDTIEIRLRQAIDPSSLNDYSVKLLRWDAQTEEEIQITPLSMTLSDAHRLTIDLTGLDTQPGHYTLILHGDGADVVQTESGHPIDGDWDGLAGGNLQLLFDYFP